MTTPPSRVSRVLGVLVGAVSATLLAVMLLAGVAYAAGVTASSRSHHVYRVGKALTLSIRGSGPQVRVLPGSPGLVTVDESAFVRTFTRELAQSALGELRTEPSGAGDRLDLQMGTGQLFRPSDLRLVSRGWTVVVRVPAATNLRVDLTGGLVVAGLTGTVRASVHLNDLTLSQMRLTGPSEATTDAGNLHLADVAVESTLKVSSSFGGVDFSGRLGHGASLQAKAGAGAVQLTLPVITDARARAETHAGSFSSDPAWHFISHQVSGGQVWTADLAPAPSGRIDASSRAGNVTFIAR